MEVDQSESGLAVAYVKRRAIADWSSSFVTLTPIGPDSGGWSICRFRRSVYPAKAWKGTFSAKGF